MEIVVVVAMLGRISAQARCHPAWQPGRARIAAAGGADRRPANIAAAPMQQSRVAHHPARPLHTDLAAPAQNAAIAVPRTVECARDGDPRLAKGVGNLSLDAFEAYVDLCWGQGLVYDAGFVESHVAVRRERDDQQHDLVALARLDQGGSGIQ